MSDTEVYEPLTYLSCLRPPHEVSERTRGGVTSEARERRPSVVLLGTFDTKGNEYAYLRDRIRERGVDVLPVDAGILAEPLIEPDVTRQEVAAAGRLSGACDAAGASQLVGRLVPASS